MLFPARQPLWVVFANCFENDLGGLFTWIQNLENTILVFEQNDFDIMI
jgi:hypothetical protein